MKKIIALFFIPVLILSMALPAFAWGEDKDSFGTKIGWNYAVITKKGSSWDAARPKAGEDLSDKVTVSYSNSNWTKGDSKHDLKNDDTEITVSCEQGYYIAYIALCCDDDKGYNCQTFEKGSSLRNSYNSAMTSVNIPMKTIRSYANHGSHTNAYWLMVMLNKNPNPVYVKYDAGEILSGKDNLLENVAAVDETAVTGASWESGVLKYEKAAAEHTVLEPNAAVKSIAAENGYIFDGWKVVFYSDSKFKTEVDSGDEKDSGDVLTLYTHAVLTACWAKKTTQEIFVTKAWEDDLESHNSVEVEISGGGKNYSVTLEQDKDWKGSVEVPINDSEGNKIEYSAAEKVIPTGYTAKVTGSAEAGFIVTNTAIPESSSSSSSSSSSASSSGSSSVPPTSSSRPIIRSSGSVITIERKTVEQNPNTGASPATGISAALLVLCGAAAYAIRKMKF